MHADHVLARTFVSPTLQRVKYRYVFNDLIKSAFQGGQPLGDQGDARVRWVLDPRAIRGVPDDGPATKDENHSSGKGKDKKIKSESKHPVQGEGLVCFSRRTSACFSTLASQGDPLRALPRWLLKENQLRSFSSSRTSLKKSLKVIPNKRAG